jgi:hypothetical protein
MKDQLTQQILNISKVVLASAGVALCVWLIAAGYPKSDAELSEIDAFVTGVYVIGEDGASIEDIAAKYADTTAEMSDEEKEDAIATKAAEFTEKWYDQKKAKASSKIEGYIAPKKYNTGKKLKNKKDYISSDQSTVQKGDEINIGQSSSFFAIDYVIYVIGLALIGVIGFFVYQLIMRPKRTILSILGLVISALVFIVLFYSGSTDTIADLQVKPEQVGPSTIALTTAGIYTIGICLSLGILAIVLGPVMGRYRK